MSKLGAQNPSSPTLQPEAVSAIRLPGPSMTHSALNCTDTQAPDRLEALHPAFRRSLGEIRPEGALPVLLSPARLFFHLP